MNASAHALATQEAWTIVAAFDARALGHAILARARSGAIRGLLALLVGCAFLAIAAFLLNQGLDLTALRVQVAAACGALASALALAQRWASDPERIGAGCLFAAAVGVATGGASLL